MATFATKLGLFLLFLGLILTVIATFTAYWVVSTPQSFYTSFKWSLWYFCVTERSVKHEECHSLIGLHNDNVPGEAL